MAKSAKRKAHDRKRGLTGPCNCENANCDHTPGECERVGKSVYKIFDLGRVCFKCYEGYPQRHRVPTQFGLYIKD
jgi:hypothetical protein